MFDQLSDKRRVVMNAICQRGGNTPKNSAMKV